MTLTIELTTEEEARLTAMAARAGLAPADYLRSVIGDDTNTTVMPKTGAELAAAIDALDLSGSYGDPAIDSPELARQFRNQLRRLDL